MGKNTDIREAVEAELTFDPLVDDADIHVMNINGDVALNGTVPTYPQYLEAATATADPRRIRRRSSPTTRGFRIRARNPATAIIKMTSRSR